VTLFIALCALLAGIAVAVLVRPLLWPARTAESAAERSPVAATVVAALLPLAAFAAYFLATNWSWDPVQQSAPAQAPDLQRMVAQLRERLTRQPDDLEGWKLLGRSATVLGDYGLAREAFGEAFTRSKGQDADAVVGYAESMVLNDERAIDGQAADLFEQALALNPDNARGLWYGGIVAYRRGDLALAQQRWVELQNHDLPPDLRQVVAERLAEIDRARGGTTAAASPAPAAAAGGIELTIELAPALAGQAPPGTMLFVIARRGDAGPPLAVTRRPIGAWPVSLRLTDADAMLPGTSLAAGGPVKVIARISRSGQPVAASGDLFGETGYDFASAHPARITIDRIVP
jgi:cytochrome c-type biogenesis protein CcmH